MKVLPAITVGDLLTSVTILISMITLAVSWRKDRLADEAQRADRIRSAAALALTKFDRWRALWLSAYDELEPSFVETSELFEQEFKVGKTRDFLWKVIHTKFSLASEKILNEEIETAYFALLSHFPAARGHLLAACEKLKEQQLLARSELLDHTQRRVLALHSKKSDYEPAVLGNELREAASECKMAFDAKSAALLQSVQEFLFGVIAKSDKEILTASRILNANTS